MPILASKLREISVFIFTLIILLVFNLYFNTNYKWTGVSLIVRVYLLVFSFYLIIIFASLDIDTLLAQYTEKFGKKGKLFLFIETRLIPFLIIYLITILFTSIDYIRSSNWPWNPVINLLNGRYSNNVLYSWILLVVLKLKKKPLITILLFLTTMFTYGILDKAISSMIHSWIVISGFKIFKILIFFIFPLTEFIKNKTRILIYSSLISIAVFLLVVSSFTLIFYNSNKSSFQHKESGMVLLKMGFTAPLQKLTDTAYNNLDYRLFKDLTALSEQYGFDINYSEKEWKFLLFNSRTDSAEIISGYLLNKNIDLSYEKILSYAEEKASHNEAGLYHNVNFIKLSSRYLAGHEKDLIERMKKSNKIMKLWGMRVLAENKVAGSIPLLLNYIVDMDETISDSAYDTLKTITEMDPAAVLEKGKNDPETIVIFKKYYLKYSLKDKL